MNPSKYDYKIYQMKAFDVNAAAIFRSYAFLVKNNQLDKIRFDNYDLIYESIVTAEKTPEETMDKLFSSFQSNKPADYKGHSLSVSDIIVLNDTAYYIDSIGFKKLDNFITERN